MTFIGIIIDCYEFFFNLIYLLTISPNPYINKTCSFIYIYVKCTHLLVIVSEPLVAEEPWALSPDTQSHVVVHRDTHRQRLLPDVKLWNTQSDNLSRWLWFYKNLSTVSLRRWDAQYLWSLFHIDWDGFGHRSIVFLFHHICKNDRV